MFRSRGLLLRVMILGSWGEEYLDELCGITKERVWRILGYQRRDIWLGKEPARSVGILQILSQSRTPCVSGALN